MGCQGWVEFIYTGLGDTDHCSFESDHGRTVGKGEP